jgi:protein SCO1/2
MRKIWGKVLFLLILGLSFIGFLIVKHLSDKNIRMPGYYVVERINGVFENGKEHYDTLYHRMRDFDLVNQLGHHIHRSGLEGKVTLVVFFRTSGGPRTEAQTTLLQKIQDTFAQSDSGLHILSITTDPRHDSVAALKAYADRYRANHDMWWFLRGDTAQIADIARRDFGVNLYAADSSLVGFFPRIILLDKRQYVRGYFDATDSLQIRRCVSSIPMLMLQKEKHAD